MELERNLTLAPSNLEDVGGKRLLSWQSTHCIYLWTFDKGKLVEIGLSQTVLPPDVENSPLSLSYPLDYPF